MRFFSYAAPSVNRNGSVGQVNSPIPGELRLQSDFQIARDPRTACAWQVLITNPTKMSADFKAAMTKLSLLGQDITKMTDCSDVIPVPQQIVPRPHFPSGHGLVDIQSAVCSSVSFRFISYIPFIYDSVLLPTFLRCSPRIQGHPSLFRQREVIYLHSIDHKSNLICMGDIDNARFAGIR